LPTQLHLPLDQAFLAQSIGLACEIVLIPIFGWVSDLIGRKPVMIAALVLDLAVTYPLFSWVSAGPSFGALLTMQIISHRGISRVWPSSSSGAEYGGPHREGEEP
jgi:MFS family permease